MTRLPAPYGDCKPFTQNDSYIYKNYDYSVEVCLIKKLILKIF